MQGLSLKKGVFSLFLNFTGDKPIYRQLAESIEEEVLRGVFGEESQIVSTTEMAVTLRINPATANKAVGQLVAEGILYKKRGLGMFVAPGAKRKIRRKRRKGFYQSFVLPLLDEAAALQMPVPEIITMLERGASGYDDHSR